MALNGKQARGQFLLLVSEAWGSNWHDALDCAVAIEIVHTASLIIDDLPVMDNASVRRGAEANHRKYGEATAILAAIAMLSEAMQCISESTALAADRRAEAIASISKAVGPEGMTGGQQLDLYPVGGEPNHIELTHAMKTGALFAAAAETGSICAGINGARRWLMSDFGMLLGKAFQELDDIIDRHGVADQAGKDLLKDREKATMVRLWGREKAEEHALMQIGKALDCLEASGAKQDDLRQYVLSLTQAMRKRLSNHVT
ncbi:MAG: polyprenyl synthetase family protein [Hyphomicrobiaceae bacterium]